MTTWHQQGKALHPTLNTVALIAIGVYLCDAGPHRPAIQPVAPLPTSARPLPQRGSGPSPVFGGTGSSYVQRRGGEAVLFKAATWLSVAFFSIAVMRIYIA